MPDRHRTWAQGIGAFARRYMPSFGGGGQFVKFFTGNASSITASNYDSIKQARLRKTIHRQLDPSASHAKFVARVRQVFQSSSRLKKMARHDPKAAYDTLAPGPQSSIALLYDTSSHSGSGGYRYAIVIDSYHPEACRRAARAYETIHENDQALAGQKHRTIQYFDQYTTIDAIRESREASDLHRRRLAYLVLQELGVLGSMATAQIRPTDRGRKAQRDGGLGPNQTITILSTANSSTHAHTGFVWTTPPYPVGTTTGSADDGVDGGDQSDSLGHTPRSNLILRHRCYDTTRIHDHQYILRLGNRQSGLSFADNPYVLQCQMKRHGSGGAPHCLHHHHSHHHASSSEGNPMNDLFLGPCRSASGFCYLRHTFDPRSDVDRLHEHHPVFPADYGLGRKDLDRLSQTLRSSVKSSSSSLSTIEDLCEDVNAVIDVASTHWGYLEESPIELGPRYGCIRLRLMGQRAAHDLGVTNMQAIHHTLVAQIIDPISLDHASLPSILHRALSDNRTHVMIGQTHFKHIWNHSAAIVQFNQRASSTSKRQIELGDFIETPAGSGVYRVPTVVLSQCMDMLSRVRNE